MENLEQTKIQHEIEQIRLETKELAKPWYKKTEFYFLIVPLIFVFGNDLVDNLIDSKISDKTEEISKLTSEVEELASERTIIETELGSLAVGLEDAQDELARAQSELVERQTEVTDTKAQLASLESELVANQEELRLAVEELGDAERELNYVEARAQKLSEQLVCDRVNTVMRELLFAFYEIGKNYNALNLGAVGTIGVREGLWDEAKQKQLDYMAIGNDSEIFYLDGSPFVAQAEVPALANSIMLAAVSDSIQDNLFEYITGAAVPQLNFSSLFANALGKIDARFGQAERELFENVAGHILADNKVDEEIGNLAPALLPLARVEIEKLASNNVEIDFSVLPGAAEEFLRFREAHRRAGYVMDGVESNFTAYCAS